MEEVVVQIERPVQFNWYEMRACLGGPDLLPAEEAIDAMLASVRWKD